MDKLLIVGRGESYKNTDFIKNFDGDIIACDSTAHGLIDYNIKFRYLTWFETSDSNTEWLVWSILHRLDNTTTLVHRTGKVENVQKEASKYNVIVNGFAPPSWCNNVGLFSIVFAQQVLHCKEIHLIGMEHRGGDYSEGWFGDMLGAFSRFWCERDVECKFVDHSNNGRLFAR